MISKKKYDFLKSLADSLTNEDREQIKDYENNNNPVVMTEKNKEYFKKVFSDPITEENFEVEYDILLKKFLPKFKEVVGVDFDMKQLDNVKTILYYFAKDKRFFKAPNLTDLSEPSFDKGLLIIGSYGNGKTSTMKTLKQLFSNTPLSFKLYAAKRIVSNFEGQGDAYERNCFIERTKRGTACFDDVKAEKNASNYGIFNLMEEIIDRRSEIESKTFITCNYKEGSGTDLKIGIDEFIERYGERVHDRLFQMFNIIEFNGKSLRR